MNEQHQFLLLRNVHKYFSGVHAVNDLSISIKKGEIHCLAGENGSGKSTLIKIISGIHAPEKGEIFINGNQQKTLTPAQAIKQGIQVIYQDFSLFNNLTVAENLTFNVNLARKKQLINWRGIKKEAGDALSRLEIDINLNQEVGTLSVAEKQLIAIARALMFNARLLIMDEPTTALTGREVKVLFDIVRGIRAEGISILFVSHKMREMLEISDRITVIRNGSKVAEGPTSEFDEKLLTWHMTGQQFSHEKYLCPEKAEKPRLQLRNFCGKAFSDINLQVQKKEIVGITGLLGSGRTEFAKALFGMEPDLQGEVILDGEPVVLHSIQQAIASGIAYVPEDRLSEGLFLDQSILRNILATTLDDDRKTFFFDRKKANVRAAEMVAELTINTTNIRNLVSTLSGGNQQRVVLGKWLLTHARVLVLNGPTVGVDVGSKAEIHQKIRTIANENSLSVLMISDDIQELVHNCNRILIMHRGRFIDEIPAEKAEENDINNRLKELI